MAGLGLGGTGSKTRRESTLLWMNLTVDSDGLPSNGRLHKADDPD